MALGAGKPPIISLCLVCLGIYRYTYGLGSIGGRGAFLYKGVRVARLDRRSSWKICKPRSKSPESFPAARRRHRLIQPPVHASASALYARRMTHLPQRLTMDQPGGPHSKPRFRIEIPADIARQVPSVARPAEPEVSGRVGASSITR